MNYALIIAGGSGNRMGQDIPWRVSSAIRWWTPSKWYVSMAGTMC